MTTKRKTSTSAKTESKKGRPGDVARLVAVGALAEGLSVQDVADRAGVSRQTLWEWRTQDPEFQRLEREALEEVLHSVVANGVLSATVRHRQLALKAIERLGQIIEEGTDEHARQAAESVLKRLPEFASKSSLEVNVSGELIARLGELDAAGDTQSD